MQTTKTAPNLTKAAGMIAPNLTFYTNPLAFNPGKVAVMLAEKRVVPQKTIKVDLFSGPSLEPAFMRISPSGAVPILVKDGEVIRESKTIAQLIDNLDGAPLGGDLVDRAFVNKFVEDIDAWDGNLWAFSHSPGAVNKIMKSVDEFRKKYAAARARENPDMKEIYDKKIATMSKAMEAASDPAQVKANEQMLSALMDTAEGRLQGGWAPTTGAAAAVAEHNASPNPEEKFLAGPAYSIADALFAPILYRVESLGSYKEVIAPRPAVSAYMKRMQARPSWKAAFGEASSTWGKVSNFVPGLISIKIRSLLHRY